MKQKAKRALKGFLWFLEGIIVGFGAIMPGISGGTLCAAFGMYLPLISVISSPVQNIKKYGKMLAVFILGGAIGFLGLSGFAGWLMGKNSDLVTCAFIGFIIGTFPELWINAGAKGRGMKAYVCMGAAFVGMLALLLLLQTRIQITLKADVPGFLLCGVLWGLSFIVPGLSSSTLLLFFGLYQPMLDGLGRLDFSVILPLAAGALACILLLSKGVGIACQRYESLISHGVIGLVAATLLMILPVGQASSTLWLMRIIVIAGGAVVSYVLTLLCGKLKK